jgi:acetate kinase
VASVLVVNAGSASLKLSLVAPDESTTRLDSLAVGSDGLAAVAHRVVHGGPRFLEPVLIDEAVELELAAVTELAPLHNTPALAAIREARRAFPDLPHVGLFDSTFHRTIPDEASTYALPSQLREWGIRRYGFHGLSVQWASEQVPASRLIVCHLGGGCSVTAVRNGRSVDTTMGFTPLEGLVMATRSGSVDPGLLLWVQRHGGIGAEEMEQALDRESGLLALSGRAGDMREIVAGIEKGDERCRLAFDTYIHRLAAGIATMAAAMGGIDALVLTGGVGENSAQVRTAVGKATGFLGIEIDGVANDAGNLDRVISMPTGTVAVLVLGAREDIELAAQVRSSLAAARQHRSSS